MKRLITIVMPLLVLSLVLLPLGAGCTPSGDSGLKVVTSTSLLASIVERVGGSNVDVVNIIPPAQCPGHFDAKPGDVQKLAGAAVFLMHGWQGEKFTDTLIASANNPNLTVHKIDIPGNWMTPPVYSEAVAQIADILSQVDAANSAYYQEQASKLKEIIEAKGAEIKNELAKEDLAGVNVFCAEQQAGFVKWVGLNLVGTFGRPDSLTPQVVKELVDKGKAAGVNLVINNLQSGQDAGTGLAEELGVKSIVLSNFPGGFDNTETWEKAIDRNIELILEATAD